MNKEISTYTFDQLSVGMSESINQMVSEEMILDFCKTTNDYHPLHSNKQYALENGFDNIIAHGLLISSLSSSLIGMKLPGENSLVASQNFHFRKPVYPGDELEITGEIIEKDERFQAVQIKIKIKKVISNELVATGKYLSLIHI